MTLVATTGCFDLFHVGHLQALEWAAAQGDRLIVGINSDASIRQLKGPTRPIIPQAHRKRILEAIRCVHAVFVFDEPNASGFLRTHQPDIWVKGAEYDGKLHQDEIAAAKEIRFCPVFDTPRTTEIIHRIIYGI